MPSPSIAHLFPAILLGLVLAAIIHAAIIRRLTASGPKWAFASPAPGWGRIDWPGLEERGLCPCEMRPPPEDPVIAPTPGRHTGRRKRIEAGRKPGSGWGQVLLFLLMTLVWGGFLVDVQLRGFGGAALGIAVLPGIGLLYGYVRVWRRDRKDRPALARAIPRGLAALGSTVVLLVAAGTAFDWFPHLVVEVVGDRTYFDAHVAVAAEAEAVDALSRPRQDEVHSELGRLVSLSGSGYGRPSFAWDIGAVRPWLILVRHGRFERGTAPVVIATGWWADGRDRPLRISRGYIEDEDVEAALFNCHHLSKPRLAEVRRSSPVCVVVYPRRTP